MGGLEIVASKDHPRHEANNDDPIGWIWDILTGLGYDDDVGERAKRAKITDAVSGLFRDIIYVPLRARIYEPELLARTGPVMYYDKFE